MISAWWLVAAFFGGAYAGIFLIGLMSLASDAIERRVPSASEPLW